LGNDITAADFDFSDDWSHVTYYSLPLDRATAKEGPWKSETYCLKSYTYEACGQKTNVSPPNPPIVKELRSPQ
jgi:hypothetical protein